MQVVDQKSYSRPRFLVRRVLGIRILPDLRAAFTGLKSLFWLWIKQDVFRRVEG
ncbi:MAG: hypothetical protein ACYC7L_02795 [Nitrospirota bacterium]